MYISEINCRRILNLNPFPEKNIIDPQVAERQFQVIYKGFNYLINPGNQFLYIADEVGLGKTYIALGIASLLRYSSVNWEKYIDAIIVPKRNLQYKWHKEIRNFIASNYIQKDNIVRSVINEPIAILDKESIFNQLAPFNGDIAAYYIFRNSSFSLASTDDEDSTEDSVKKRVWVENLKNRLPENLQPLFIDISKKFNNIIIKRAFAYLLNTIIPEIDLLIVDESHNYKHGIGDGVSVRNQLVSRMLGAVSEDKELFGAYPELKQKIKPKVKKLIFLSATPIDRGLIEIKNQLDCFLPDHLFHSNRNIEIDEKEINRTIEAKLNQFMIRGVMKLVINGEKFSRNCYRHEHRLGNVDMIEQGKHQFIKDESTAVFLGLMQYKTLKELKHTCGNSFEMGMLAGFESFKGNSNYEKDSVEDKKSRIAKDEDLITTIVESYQDEFNKYPPHPKQDTLVEELFILLMKREKALVFVRRIASVKELEQKVLKKYSDELIEKIKKVKGKKKNIALEVLLKNYEDEKDRERIDKTLNTLADKIFPEVKDQISQLNNSDSEIEFNPKEKLCSDLHEIYNSLVDESEINGFRDLVKIHVRKTNFSDDFKKISRKLIEKKCNGQLIIEPDDDVDNDEFSIEDSRFEEEKAPYFFQRFFYNEGAKFKKKIYRSNWFEMNYLLLNDKYQLFHVDNSVLETAPSFQEKSSEYKRFTILKEILDKAIKQRNSVNGEVLEIYRTNTFITELLIVLCSKEFSEWIKMNSNLISESSISSFIAELEYLIEIIKSIFRQGSGLLPAFIADTIASDSDNSKESFILALKELLTGEFSFVLDEIKKVIEDFSRLIDRNFDDRNRIRYNLIQQLPVVGISGQHKKDIKKAAIQFRMPGYPYILITTDILKEGEDLHSYCKNIYHYGIAWNPSEMEQRTGRIDRIDSLTYKQIKEVENQKLTGIPFLSKLQVFYPYLADTLEVNQMVKLFLGMDNFIKIFYDNLAAGKLSDAKANTDEMVTEIPMQWKGLLESKYEHDNFLFTLDLSEEIEIRTNTVISEDFLLSRLDNLYSLLSENHEIKYFIIPELDKMHFKIRGDMDINSRKGPFIIEFCHGKIPGSIVWLISSCLGRTQDFSKPKTKQRVDEKINLFGYKLVEKNSLVWTYEVLELSCDLQTIIKDLIQLVIRTDNIEEEIVGDDFNVSV